MDSAREKNIQSAIDEVRSGKKKVREAASDWEVPKSTLSDRLNGVVSKKASKIDKMQLSLTQESFLVDWALDQEAAGRAPSKAELTRMAETILAHAGTPARIGCRWADRFLRRHKRVKTKQSVSLERARVRGSTRAAYDDFFSRLRRILDDKKIVPCNIGNMDEHGMQENETRSGNVIGDSLTNHAVATNSDSTTWVTVIEAVTAEGRRLPPAIVFTGASLQGQWFPRWLKKQPELRDWKYHYSPTGWSNADIAIRWLKEIYLPETQPQNRNDWRLLILDEHGSHETPEFMWLCKTNRVQLLYLPHYTSQKSQPLDRSVFSPLKNYFRQETKPLAHCRPSAPANKQRFLIAYRTASREGCSASNIRSGFRQTGIWPYNPSAILDDPKALIGDAPLPPREQPPTPPLTTASSPELLNTPKKSQDLREIANKDRGVFTPSRRTRRALLHKMGKGLDTAAAERAALQKDNERLTEDFRVVGPHTKKRVREPPNDKFARIEDIIAAEEASHQPLKRRRGRRSQTLRQSLSKSRR